MYDSLDRWFAGNPTFSQYLPPGFSVDFAECSGPAVGDKRAIVFETSVCRGIGKFEAKNRPKTKMGQHLRDANHS
jgi:hypothetical protein